MADLGILLADTSAWHRSRLPEIVGVWERSLNADRIATTAFVRLEVLYSAQDGLSYRAVAGEMDELIQLPCGDAEIRRALEVQQLLSDLAPLHHRVALPDLVIAAVAELNGATVWHYDGDFDRITQVTGQPTEWIAPRGSI